MKNPILEKSVFKKFCLFWKSEEAHSFEKRGFEIPTPSEEWKGSLFWKEASHSLEVCSILAYS